MTEELEQLLKNLKLRRMLEIYEEQLRAADKEDISYSDFVTRLVRAQWQAKQEGALEWRIRRANLPERWSLETFPFARQPGVNRKQIRGFAELEFIAKAENIVFWVATKRRIVTNERDCNQPWAEPGGSMDCQRITEESPVPAYQVTYSYRGRPMVSDEYGNTYFTFSVYFRQDEISPRQREILALGKIRRAALEEFFEVTTSRAPTQQIVIDSANSTLCDGNYLDGNWTRTNPTCEDKIVYQRVASASPYITVRVDPASSRIEAAAAASGPSRK